MDKYSVETDKKDPQTKEAREKGKCPKCGDELEKDANVPKCPTHGVEPFQEGLNDPTLQDVPDD